MARAKGIKITEDQKEKLQRIVNKKTAEQRLVQRARIILLLSEAKRLEDVRNEIGMSEDSIIKWRRRFENSGLDGLKDIKRSGRPRVYDALIRHEIAAKACTPPVGETHFSIRGLAKELSSGGKGPSKTTIHRVLKNEIIKPHRYRMWLNPNDPLFEEKMLNIVGLYLNPPENAVVLSIDEKSSIQALERRYPNLKPGPGRVERIEHEYIRHGTQSLIAALEVHSGSVTGKCYERHTHVEFLDFLKEVEKTYPVKELHIIADNLSVHKQKDVKKWLKDNPRIVMHFTPTHASWLNQIELFFSILSRKVLKRGSFRSMDDLKEKLLFFIEKYNREAQPFKWTYTGDPLAV